MSPKGKIDGRFMRAFELAIDLVLINLGFYAAFMLRYGFQPAARNIEPFYELIPVISVVAFFIFFFYRIHSTNFFRLLDMAYHVAFGISLLTLTAVSAAFFARGFSFPRSVFLIALFTQFILVFAWKTVLLKVVMRKRIKKDTLILGPLDDALRIARKVLLHHNEEYRIKYVETRLTPGVEQLLEEVDVVILSSLVEKEEKSRVITHCIGRDKTVFLLPELYEISLQGASIQQFDDIPTCKIDNLYLTMESRILKRALDLVIAFTGIILLSPVMLVIVFMIKKHDHGPVIFFQERVTRNNKVFKMYKFRTMIVNAETKTGPVLTSENDDRLLPFGQFLRRTRLDELPQLFNIIQGSMSLVGPRPERPFFIRQIQEQLPDFKYRLTVKAGLTGLAQVAGKYTTTPQDKLRFDLLYIRSHSMLLDLRIIADTIKIILSRDKAKGTLKQKPSNQEIMELLDCRVNSE